MKRRQVHENEAAPYGDRAQLYALYQLFQNEPNIEDVDLGDFEKTQKISKNHREEEKKHKFKKNFEKKKIREMCPPSTYSRQHLYSPANHTFPQL
ncbi:Protein CBG17055 [Caenorhabditis briggsae]|uniref:Protein CBG17055 n=1 Tax=Caenorhabditis briggsae TaxID=6238 RepID=A8XQC2_CAEBR|nr:Protein CBG17055 [Caenorhabditis briggsae]CAP34840.1 Protein CBG17055 [Caenorhabditis briggsae]